MSRTLARLRTRRRHSDRRNGVNSLSLIRASLNRARDCRSLLLPRAENLHLTTGLHDRRQNGRN